MARQFKASTFFKKYVPEYALYYTIGEEYQQRFSYEFMESPMDENIIDFCESRMLISIYSVISIFENRLVVPSGKCVDLKDFSKEALSALQSIPSGYFNSNFSSYVPNTASFVSLSTANLKRNISMEDFKTTDFYADVLFSHEIIKKTAEILDILYQNTTGMKMDFILSMDTKNAKRFQALSEHYKILEDEAINSDNLEIYSTYSAATIKDPERLELFKIFDRYEKRIASLLNVFKGLVNDLIPKKERTAEDIKKEKFIAEFREHYSLYAETNMRADISRKLSTHYDLVDGIKLFSCFPYSSRQYENQAYTPLMIKAPIKKITEALIAEVEDISLDFPHFSEVVNYIALSLKVRLLTDGIIKFKHLLLVGGHGVGKNAFVSRLNAVLGYVGNSINMTSVIAPFELSGMDAGWNGSAPGFFFNTILKNNAANPIIILDDLDKVSVNPNHGNVNSTVIELIEPSNAKKYYERFFQIDLNMSYVSVIGLANNIDEVDKGVLDLFKVFNIDKPTVSSISSIVFSIYKELKLDDIYGFANLTNIDLNELVAKFIMSKTFSPRSMKKVIEDALNDKLLESVQSKEDNKEGLISSPDDKKDTPSFQLINKEK